MNCRDLTHWGRVTRICVINLSPHWFRKWLLAWLAPSHYLNQCWNIVNSKLRTNFYEILSKIHMFSFEKMHLKMSSGKLWPFCLDLNVLTTAQDTRIVVPANVCPVTCPMYDNMSLICWRILCNDVLFLFKNEETWMVSGIIIYSWVQNQCW